MRAGIAVALLVALAAMASGAENRQKMIDSGRRLIETKPNVRAWMTEDEVLNLIYAEVGFMDITDHETVTRKAPKALAIPTNPTHQAEVRNLISLVNVDNIEADLNVFTAFNNRYYRSDTGVQSSDWLFSYVKEIASNSSLNISVNQFSHSFVQDSLIASIAGSQSTEKVIIGAHQDSIAGASPMTSRAPGADDDGSGSMTILELFRVIVASGFRPQLTLEFHWYAAEEAGLLGSLDIATEYADQGIPVRSMMQFDMVGYSGSTKSIGLITDYTSADLNVFTRKLITEYLNIGYTNSVCGYGCSDHASWNRQGYHSAFPFEAPFGSHSPSIHTSRDTIDTIDTIFFI